jgi:hypothetical protein
VPVASSSLTLGSVLLVTLFIGCGAKDGGGSGNGNESGNGSVSGNSSGGASGSTTNGEGLSISLAGSGNVAADNAGAAGSCVSQNATTNVRPVYLAFAFDVSGSMGKLDKAWHDPELKWKPVVATTEAFFSDTSSQGIEASLTFFPGSEDKCDSETYAVPDVSMTPLPSTDFADAITAVTPATSDDWRGNTPTLAVVTGTFEQLQPLLSEHPDASVALVLVTDGYPQGCDDDEIASVQVEVATHPDIPTYVIGIQNPPLDGAPDTVSNLHGIAQSGGTGQAFLIATGEPTHTAEDFASVIAGIRGAAISCELTIPKPPSGDTLNYSLVNVTYTSGTNSMPLVHDPNCVAPGAWKYDNELSPNTVILCPNDCTNILGDPVANVVIEFGCATRDEGPLR